jgi:transposase
VRPRDLVGKTRRRIAADEVAELVGIGKKAKALAKQIEQLVVASGPA